MVRMTKRPDQSETIDDLRAWRERLAAAVELLDVRARLPLLDEHIQQVLAETDRMLAEHERRSLN